MMKLINMESQELQRLQQDLLDLRREFEDFRISTDRKIAYNHLTKDTITISHESDTATPMIIIDRMLNTSGGTLNAGDVVILKSVATGKEITTTTTQGDDKVYGVVSSASIANNAYGLVQTIGKITTLKVDGTADIAIGDFLSTFTTAKIAAKSGAGDMAFAIALEAYATDDSNGVIDALLITPRKI